MIERDDTIDLTEHFRLVIEPEGRPSHAVIDKVCIGLADQGVRVVRVDFQRFLEPPPRFVVVGLPIWSCLDLIEAVAAFDDE